MSEFWPLKHEQPGLGHLSADEAAEKVTRSGRGSPQVAGRSLLEQLGQTSRSLRA